MLFCKYTCCCGMTHLAKWTACCLQFRCGYLVLGTWCRQDRHWSTCGQASPWCAEFLPFLSKVNRQGDMTCDMWQVPGSTIVPPLFHLVASPRSNSVHPSFRTGHLRPTRQAGLSLRQLRGAGSCTECLQCLQCLLFSNFEFEIRVGKSRFRKTWILNLCSQLVSQNLSVGFWIQVHTSKDIKHMCVSLSLSFCVSCPHLHPFGLSVIYIYICLPHFNLSQLHQPAIFCVVPPRDASKHLRVYVLLDLLIFTVCCEPKAS